MKFTKKIVVCAVMLVALYSSFVFAELCDVYNVSIHRNEANLCSLKIRCLDGTVPELGACLPRIEALSATKF